GTSTRLLFTQHVMYDAIDAVGGGPEYGSVDAWCLAMYNSTACNEIREDAESETFGWTARMLSLQVRRVIVPSAYPLPLLMCLISLLFVLCVSAQGSVGILNVLQLMYAMAVCSFILTKPVIMDTMNDIINYLLLIPVVGCLLMG